MNYCYHYLLTHSYFSCRYIHHILITIFPLRKKSDFIFILCRGNNNNKQELFSSELGCILYSPSNDNRNLTLAHFKDIGTEY